jgi:tetratricopeptide (TPR) repeat protein
MGVAEKLRRAEEHFLKGDLDSAGRLLIEAHQDNPNHKEVLNNLGVLAFTKDEPQLAEIFIKRALAQDPDYLDAILNLADVLRSLDRICEIRPYLEPLLANHPDDPSLQTLRTQSEITKDKGIDEFKLDESGKTVEGKIKTEKARSEIEEMLEGLDKSPLGVARIQTPVPAGTTGSVQPAPILKGAPEIGDRLRSMKILHAPFEIAGNMGIITRALRKVGLNAASANYYDTWLNYNCDYNIHINRLPLEKRETVIREFAVHAMAEFEIFHFHFLQSLYPDLRDLEELKNRNKKICFSFWGSDNRAPEWIYYQQARFLGHKPPKPYFFNIQLYAAHKRINQFADVLFGMTVIPRGIKTQGYVETRRWTLKEKDSILDKKFMSKDPKKTYFLHAPSSNIKKGSSIIMRLLEECKNDGLPIEVIYVSGKKPDDAKKLYAYADYAIDQVGVGGFGLFGVEMMCWEIPVLVHQVPLFDRIRGNPPVIKITKESFKERIEECVLWKKSGKREEIGFQAREWAIKNADVSRMLPVYLSVYDDLAEGRPVPQLVNTSWFREEQKLQEGQKSDFYRYMLENKVFDETGVPVPEYDRRLYN